MGEVGRETLGARFVLERELGRGGMGVVYQALDRQWNVRVAVKTLRSLAPLALLRLKNEFRSLEGIRHPNLVRLGELLVEEGHWLLTMELVDGVDFIRWVRHHGAPDEPRLRDGVRQLAAGLRALHRAGRVHRDVKPSNVLVTRQGRVVLLDFGLITRVAADDSMTEGMMVGTLGYMAPEQAAGQPVTPAADWFALGALLVEALTGKAPSDGPGPPLAGAPDDLAQLARGLLHPDPDRRIGWRELATLFGLPDEPVEPREPVFVGRADELDELERALPDARAGGSLTVFVFGSSGIGKTSLARQLARRVLERADDTLVLESKASDRELVPFNGFDGVVDGLMRHLAELPGDELRALLPEDRDALAELFPVMSRFATGQPARADEAAPARRKRGFAALRQLLAAIARRRPLLLIIDDFQWADEDALALRRAVMADATLPGWLLVATVRSDGDERAFARRAVLSADEAAGRVRHLVLQPLSGAEAAELVRELGGERAPHAAPAAGGHPLFLAELARGDGAAGRDLRATIGERLAALSPEARRLMEVLAVGAGALRPPLAAAAAELDAERYARVADEVRAARLARAAGAGLLGGIEPYHDLIRQEVLQRLPAARLRQLHRALAQAIEAQPLGSEPRRLFAHWLGAGEGARAARAAEVAAAHADAQLAFELAADYYGRALELGDERARRGPLLALRARALANAGRKRDAVAAYRQAAAVETGLARLEHLRCAAEVLLNNGDIDEGIDLIGEVLRGVGLVWPRGPGRALLSLAATRAQLELRGLGWRERSAASIPPETLARIDTAWSVAMALTLVDRARGADFQARGLLLSLRAGEPYRVARAIIFEAAYSCMGGSRARPETHALLEEGRRLAERCGHPHARALLAAIEGIAHTMEGDFRTGAREIAAAEPLLRAHASRWDRLNAEYLLLMSLSLLGELREVERRATALADEARATDDLSLLVNVSTGHPPLARLANDDAAGARRAIDDAMRSWSQRGFHRQTWSALFARANCDLYEGQGERVWQALRRARLPLWRSLLWRSQPVRVFTLDLRARAALATGRTRQARRDAGRLEREGVAWASGFAALVRAGLSPSPAAFVQAADQLAAAGLGLHAAVARRRAGIDDPWWREQAVAQPDRFIRCFSPDSG